MSGNEPGKWAARLAIGRDAVVVVLGTGIVLMALWWVLSRLGNVVVVLMMAGMFEITLSPMVDRLALYWNRPLAVLVVVLGTVVIFVVGGILLVTVIAGQLATLVAKLPNEVQTLTQTTPGLMAWFRHTGIQVNILQLESRLFSSLGQVSTFLVTQTVTFVTHLIDSIVDGAITIFITVYLLLDANRIQAALLRLIPHHQREGLLAVEHTLSRVIGGYVRGQMALSLIVGTAFGFGTWLIGLPYPLVIGVFAAIMELIPLLGPVLGAILPVLLALFNHPWVQIPEVLVLLAAAHLLESQILGPKIIRSQVGVHPVISVLALMIGASLRGILGALFAVPIAGILVAAWVAGVRVWREKVVLPSQPTPPID
ncbi:AI-2E family transporter [Sulfobacillus thermosulfidooxidans]|uniref:AI-2E family transporter n=1 Tax=Sulfobacillus thermosulfidooxidans TaxID=28034 RepID=UPI0006B59F09|nr:AI-2E family transporter [Sulfobacillus thermosulfidooxidans]